LLDFLLVFVFESVNVLVNNIGELIR